MHACTVTEWFAVEAFVVGKRGCCTYNFLLNINGIATLRFTLPVATPLCTALRYGFVGLICKCLLLTRAFRRIATVIVCSALPYTGVAGLLLRKLLLSCSRQGRMRWLLLFALLVRPGGGWLARGWRPQCRLDSRRRARVRRWLAVTGYTARVSAAIRTKMYVCTGDASPNTTWHVARRFVTTVMGAGPVWLWGYGWCLDAGR